MELDLGYIKPTSICASCRHFNQDDWNCAAFKGPIPQEIISGKIEHTTAYPGDNGLIYEPIKADGDNV